MKKKTFAVVIFLWLVFFSAVTMSQPVILWQKTFGGSYEDDAWSMQRTQDGGYILAGGTDSHDGNVSINHGSFDFWVVKTNNSGGIQWEKSLGGSDVDIAHSVAQTSDGGYIVAGSTMSNDSDVSGNHGDFDCWIVKLNNIGNIQWQKCLGGSGADEAWCVQQTTDGGYIVCATTISNDGDVTGHHGPVEDYWIVKLNPSGNIIWQKALGGFSRDIAHSILQTSDGGYIVAGASCSNDGDVTGNHSFYYDSWIVKLDGSGNIQWEKCYGGTNQDGAWSIIQLSDGSYVIAGSSMSNDGDVTVNHGLTDYWIVKINSNGNLLWQKSFGGADSDDAFSIAKTSDDGFVISGTSNSNDGDVSGNHGGEDCWIVKINSSGDLVWQNSFGGSDDDYIWSVQQTIPDCFLATTESNDGNISGNHGYYDFWMFQITPEPPPTFSADVYVKYNGQNQANAEVFVNNGYGLVSAGFTGTAGEPVHINNLKVGSKLRAETKIYTQSAVKTGHEAVGNTMFELWFDSEIMIPADGSYKQFEILQQNNVYDLPLIHPVYRYNLVVSAEWNMDDLYYHKLETGLKMASKLLYNATDGQACFNTIVIYNNDNHGEGADVIIHTGVGDWFRGPGYNDDVDGIDNKWWIDFLQFRKSKHIHMAQNYLFTDLFPDWHEWWKGLVHEFGHYAFGFYDEYLNGKGRKWADFPEEIYCKWNPGGPEHPGNYGIMQDQTLSTEFSSFNDYLLNYPDYTPACKVTLQLQNRQMPCWTWMVHKMNNYYQNDKIIEPPFGWYPCDPPPYDGRCTNRQDRLGPDDFRIYVNTQIIDMRSKSKTIPQQLKNLKLILEKSDLPVCGANIYKIRGYEKIFYGQTNCDGTAAVSNIGVSDTLLVTKKMKNHFIQKKIPVSMFKGSNIINLDESIEPNDGLSGTDPGIVIDARITLTGNYLNIGFSLWFDQTVTGITSAQLHYAGKTDNILFVQGGSLNEFIGTASIDANTSDFDGTGSLDITFPNGSFNNITFNTDFKIISFQATEYNMFWEKNFNYNSDLSNYPVQEFGILLSTSYLPFQANGQTLYPVSDMYIIKAEQTNILTDSAGLNMYYTDAEVHGYDETSLGIYRWDSINTIWQQVPGGGTGYHSNVTSALVTETGTYAIFASQKCTDSISPGNVNDLIAKTGQGQAMIELNWTAPGENNALNQANNYILRFNQVPITQANWDSSFEISYAPTPAPYGSHETFSFKLPQQDQIYYFALKSDDKCGNISSISNIDSAYSSIMP